MANTIIYAEDWATRIQERLTDPALWRVVNRVDISNKRVLHFPYETDATVQTTARNSAYTHQDLTFTDESVTIDSIGILPQKIDRADLAQTDYAKQMDIADRQGVLLTEHLDNKMLAEHASWTDFGTADIGAGGTSTAQITVSVTNIDDIIRSVKREIREAKGDNLLRRNGGFFIWRPADFEILEAYVQANGFTSADDGLINGTLYGMRYMGMEHYVSNQHTANHVFAGVKGLHHVGVVSDTFGQVVVDQEPATSSGAVSSIAVISRVDYKYKTWTNFKPVLFDVNVA